MSTVVIGLGNTTLSDDGAGPLAARELGRRLAREVDAVQVVELGIGGLRLMETMVGHERAIVLDALHTGQLAAGTVVELDLDDLDGSLHQCSVHDMSLPAALAVGQAAGVDLPSQIRVLGIEVLDVTTFSHELSPAVAQALPELVARAMELARTEDWCASRTAPGSGHTDPSDRLADPGDPHTDPRARQTDLMEETGCA